MIMIDKESNRDIIMTLRDYHDTFTVEKMKLIIKM